MNVLPLLILLAAPAVDFDTEIIPLLTKVGCNAGACHGAAAGRGGFQLSLLGSNPAADYDRIVRELEGRRVNLARPQASLILAKPSGTLDHEGGVRFDDDSPQAARLRAWLAAGAPRLKLRRLVRYEVTPREQVLERPGESVALKAIAVFDDGSQQDVTPWTVFTSSDPAALEVDDAGQATLHRPGQHTLLLRFLSEVVAVRISAPLGEAVVDLSRERRANFIDDEVLATLATLRVPPASPAEDGAFLRRVRIDLTGRLPSKDEVRQFLGDRSGDKKERLVDRLLASPEFVDYWTFQFAKLLRVQSKSMQVEGATALHGWLRERVARNAPWDATVRELVTATGDSHRVGAANFYRVGGNARDQAEFFSEALMGVRLRCANCHDHPLDRWTQDDYHGLAANFARLERGREVRVTSRGEVTHPVTGEPAQPRLPGVRFLKPEDEVRTELAGWLIARENPYFAASTVNRLWKALLGRGLVEPVDDLRATNPATHPKLLDRLAQDFVSHGYDVRQTLRLIATSATYARRESAGESIAGIDELYAGAIRRPLEAEVLLDALADVTGVAEAFAGQVPGTRAVMLVDGVQVSTALDLLGRCARGSGTCGGATTSGGLSTRLHLINGELLNKRLTSDEGTLAKRLAEEPSDDKLLAEFFLTALAREPRPREREVLRSHFAKAKSPEERRRIWEDVLWGMLSSREFTTNH